MIDFFHDHSAIDETNVQAETDRYIAWARSGAWLQDGSVEDS